MLWKASETDETSECDERRDVVSTDISSEIWRFGDNAALIFVVWLLIK